MTKLGHWAGCPKLGHTTLSKYILTYGRVDVEPGAGGGGGGGGGGGDFFLITFLPHPLMQLIPSFRPFLL